jgi:hypothetical protein
MKTRRRKTQSSRRRHVARVIFVVVALHCVILAGLYVFDAGSSTVSAPCLNMDDQTNIRNYLRRVSPPPSLAVRLVNALRQATRTIQDAPEFVPGSSHAPVRITMLLVTPDGILLGTESHGMHIYNRLTRTWLALGEEESDDTALFSDPAAKDNSEADTAPETPVEHARELQVLKVCLRKSNAAVRTGRAGGACQAGRVALEILAMKRKTHDNLAVMK